MTQAPAVPTTAPAAARPRRLALTVLGAAAAGVPAGVAWWLLAPTARTTVENGSVFLEGHQELHAGQDGWLAIVLLGLGVLLGIGHAVRVRAGGEVRSLVALTTGALLAGPVAWFVGARLGPPGLRAQLADGSTHPTTPLDVRAWGVVGLAAVALVVTRLVLALLDVPKGTEPSSAGDGGHDGPQQPDDRLG